MSIKKVQESSELYVCKLCDYTTCRKSQYIRHLTTDKHKNNDLAINGNDLAIIKVPNEYICTLCKKIYKDPSGLWRHKKKCNVTIVTDSNVETIDKDQLILMLIKQNSELIKETTDFKNIMRKGVKM